MLLALSVLVLAAPCRDVRIEAALAPDLSTISGTTQCVVNAGGTLSVTTYPRLLAAPDSLSEIRRPWYYPEGSDPADMRLSRGGIALMGLPGPWQTLGPVRQDEVVALDFTTRIPRRNGSFGRRGGTAWLLGGWHPSFGPEDTPLAATRIHYEIDVPKNVAGFVGGKPFGMTSPRHLEGDYIGRELPMLVTQAAHVMTTSAAVIVSPGPRGAGLRDQPSADALRELSDTLASGRAFATQAGVRYPGPLLVVLAPQREHLVERFDGGLVVSDRVFALPPLELFRRFHRIRLWRAELAALAEAHAARVEPAYPEIAADVVGAALRDRLLRARYGAKSFVPDLLGNFAVIPEIEALVFAPQIQFVDAFFEAVDERPAQSLELDNFMHPLPRGKLLYEKLVDRLGEPATQAIVDTYLAGDTSLLATIDAATAERLRAWLGPAPRLDYGIARVHETPERIALDIAALGAENLREPVTVRVIDANGAVHELSREGAGPLEVNAPGPAASIEIDPAGRLVELEHPPGFGPRYNDALPPRWRFLLNNVSGLVAVTNRQLSVDADFSLRRIHDLRYRFDFQLSGSAEAYGAGATASYGFGDELTPLRLAERIGLGLRAQRLRVERDLGQPGTVGTLSAFYLYDSRLSAFGSFVGQGVYLRGSTSLALDDDRRTRRYGQLTASAFHIFPFGFYHALLVRGRADLVLGEAPEQLGLRLGDRYVAGRGFEPDEALGKRRGVFSLEYRHAIAVDARTDLFGLFTLTRLEGALFSDAVYLPVERSGCHRDGFADVGYGLRFLGDLFNVSPSSLQVDVGVPFGRCPDETGRAPVTIYLAFVQSFLVF